MAHCYLIWLLCVFPLCHAAPLCKQLICPPRSVLFHQFELCPNGRLRYANSARYKHAGTIRKEAFVSPGVLDQARRIIEESGIIEVDPKTWPQATDRKQELEVKIGEMHMTFACAEIGSLLDVQKSDDPEGLKNFYYLVQDLKTLVFSLIALHFRIKPLG